MTNTDLNQLHNLLNIYNDFKHELLNKKSQGINDYNLITSLLKKHDEMRVHSRFLKSMLNPNGAHYQDDAFLKIFLNLFIPSDPPPNLSNCNVYNEKDNIDLLIEDGEKYIIIENKIYAHDQPYQITGYINKTLKKGAEHQNIMVIYLSLDGKLPTWEKDGDSCYGFNIENNRLIWRNIPECNNFTYITKIKDIAPIPLITLSYHHDIPKWIDQSIALIEAKKPTENIQFAFEQYQSVLNMLNPNRKWKKMPNFIDKILEEEKNLDYYDVLAQSHQCFTNYVSKNLENKLLNIFKGYEMTMIKIDDDKEKPIVNFQSAIKKWLEKDGNWKNIGFKAKHNDKEYIFMLGQTYAYLAKGDNYIFAKDKDGVRINKIDFNVRHILKEKNNFDTFIETIENKLKKLNENK